MSRRGAADRERDVSGLVFLLGAALGYAMAAFTFGGEAKFWKSRADYWYDNSTAWMRSALRHVEIRPKRPRRRLTGPQTPEGKE